MSMEIKLQNDVVKSEEKQGSQPLDRVKDYLKSIDVKYESSYPNTHPDEATMPQFKPQDRPGYSQILQEAEAAMGEYEIASKKEIQNDYVAKLNEIDSKKDTINAELAKDTEELKQDRIVSTEKNRADMVAQGIERSSIAANTEQGIEDNYNRELVDLIEKTQLSLSELELKKSIAQNEMDVALDKFDIAYAAKLEKKIDEISKHYDQEMLDLERYNLQIAKLRNQRNEEWREWVEAKNSQINAEKSHAKVKYLIDVIKQMPKSEAVEIINDPEVIASLGAQYQIVLDYVNRRK